MLASLLARRVEMFLQRLLLGGDALQLGRVVGLQLVTRLAQLPLLTVQRLADFAELLHLDLVVGLLVGSEGGELLEPLLVE